MPSGARLTVREIRGLLTKMGADLVHTLGAGQALQPSKEEPTPVKTSRFVESMSPFLRMN